MTSFGLLEVVVPRFGAVHAVFFWAGVVVGVGVPVSVPGAVVATVFGAVGD